MDGFWHLLEGRQFTIYTDHKLLTYALCRPSDLLSARQVRQLIYLTEHTADIRHIAGEDNVVNVTLFRPPAPTRSLAAAWQVGKPDSSPQPMGQPAVCHVPATLQRLDFAAISEHQKTDMPCHAAGC